MTRKEIRETAFIIIYQKCLRDDTDEELYELAEETGLEINDKVKELVGGVGSRDEEICGIIANYSKKRAVSRIPKITLSLMKIAVYEALYDDMTPVNAAISEAVSLSNAYSYKEDTSFLNGVLGSFARDNTGEGNG